MNDFSAKRERTAVRGIELPFTSPWILAPMDGVTDACFRDLLLSRHTPADLGGAFTEFVRIHQTVPHRRFLEAHLGPNRFEAPVGLQFMGKDLGLLRDSAAAVADMGVPVLDLNFGCPAKKAGKGCVGAALLDFPEELTPIIDACVDGVARRIPVTAKIRSGVNDDRLLEDIVKAVDASGASMLTIHCRTKREGYDESAIDWKRIAKARAVTSLALCGNGGVSSLVEAERMRQEVGCEYVMIGRAALANPWVFSSYEATTDESVAFFLEYAEMMLERGSQDRHVLARLKQMMRFWVVADLVPDDEARVTWLRIKTLGHFLEQLRLRLKD